MCQREKGRAQETRLSGPAVDPSPVHHTVGRGLPESEKALRDLGEPAGTQGSQRSSILIPDAAALDCFHQQIEVRGFSVLGCGGYSNPKNLAGRKIKHFVSVAENKAFLSFSLEGDGSGRPKPHKLV